MRQTAYLFVTGLPAAMVESRLVPVLREDRDVRTIALIAIPGLEEPVIRVGIAIENEARSRMEKRILTNFTGVRVANAPPRDSRGSVPSWSASLLYERSREGAALVRVTPAQRRSGG